MCGGGTGGEGEGLAGKLALLPGIRCAAGMLCAQQQWMPLQLCQALATHRIHNITNLVKSPACFFFGTWPCSCIETVCLAIATAANLSVPTTPISTTTAPAPSAPPLHQHHQHHHCTSTISTTKATFPRSTLQGTATDIRLGVAAGGLAVTLASPHPHSGPGAQPEIITDDVKDCPALAVLLPPDAR